MILNLECYFYHRNQVASLPHPFSWQGVHSGELLVLAPNLAHGEGRNLIKILMIYTEKLKYKQKY